MPIEHPLIRRRPVGAILEARRREKAALTARCRSFGAIAEAMAHYGRDRGPTLTSADTRGRWEQLGDYAGAGASADAASLRASSGGLGRPPGSEPPHERHGTPAGPRAAAHTRAAP